MQRLLLILLLCVSFPVIAADKNCRCRANETCWPDQKAWQHLQSQLTGKLIQPQNPFDACKNDTKTNACQVALKQIHNPYYLETNPGAVQSQGWLNAWINTVSPYAVAVENTQDVVKAVNFAREHHLKIVIKGTGHDYLGRSNGGNALLIWTHPMQDILYDKNFVAKGCKTAAQEAITYGAGTRWIQVYDTVVTQNHRYVQGGGCATVGAAGGFPQGGGFGSFSKKFGTGSGGILQAEIVTADGKVLIANQCQNTDLFNAIRGGGGGTFGVVTHLTLRTHPLPSRFGAVFGTIKAKDDVAYKALIRQFLMFYREKLNNEHWGEQFIFYPNNTLELALVFQGFTDPEVKKLWEPFANWLKKSNDKYTFKWQMPSMPADKWWDAEYLKKHFPQTIAVNDEVGAKPWEVWFAGNTQEVSKYWYTYQSWWIPRKVFDDLDRASKLFYDASRLHRVSYHINKGLQGASKEAIALSKTTMLNPMMFTAAGLVIMGDGTNEAYPALGQLDKKVAAERLDQVNKAMQLFVDAAPSSGSYLNEADYFQKEWQQAFWGMNYSFLLNVKNKYDPDGVFYCHHCVGSEKWSDDGMCRI